MATSHSEHRRQEMHERAREQMLADFDKQKQDLAKEAEKHASGQDRFVNTYDTLEESLKKQTIGLVRLEDFQKRRAELEEEKLRQAAQTDELKCVPFPCLTSPYLLLLEDFFSLYSGEGDGNSPFR